MSYTGEKLRQNKGDNAIVRADEIEKALQYNESGLENERSPSPRGGVSVSPWRPNGVLVHRTCKSIKCLTTPGQGGTPAALNSSV